MRSIATMLTFDSEQPPLPPTALGLSLLEIYFTRIYNASILFCKPILFQEYLEGRVHGALLRALFALATLCVPPYAMSKFSEITQLMNFPSFLHPRNDEEECATDGNAELKVLSVYHSCGLPWAKAALREVMPLAIESPSLMIVQALECIQLYWFGIGQPHSGNLCLGKLLPIRKAISQHEGISLRTQVDELIGLAYRSCQMLGYDRKYFNENDGLSESVESELGRRCFWACWTSTCIVMEPEPYIESAWKEVAMLPLPGSISSAPSGCEVTLNQMMDRDWHSIIVRSSRRGSHPTTAVGSLVKIIGVW